MNPIVLKKSNIERILINLKGNVWRGLWKRYNSIIKVLPIMLKTPAARLQ